MGWGSNRVLSEREIEIIKRYWDTLTVRQIAQRLGRSTGSISNRARALGLPPKTPPTKKKGSS